MLNKENKNGIMKATIKSVIVAFIYIAIIITIVYICFSGTISRAISLIDMVSRDTTEKILRDVKIDLETKNLKTYPEYGTRYGRIKIPALDIDLDLYYGDTLDILRYGVGHSSGSYFPGEGGSIICMGHNTKGYLRRLPEIENGTEIKIETTYGIYTYKVYETKVVHMSEVDAVYTQREKEILMLYTCYPVNSIGHAKSRFITYAEKIKDETW